MYNNRIIFEKPPEIKGSKVSGLVRGKSTVCFKNINSHMVKILLVIENDILCQLAFMKVPVYTYS